MSIKKIIPTGEAYSYPLLIKRILQQSLIDNPENEIIYRDQVRMNYHDLNKRIAQLANALKSLGVEAGDVVGVMEFDSHRYLELYFAVPMIGAVLHTINYRLSSEQMLYTINHAEDKVIFCNQVLEPLLEVVYPKLETVKKCILLSDEPAAESGALFQTEYEGLLSRQSELYSFPDFDENTMATLFYTTGTTGLPKGVCFSHRQLVLHTMAVMGALGAIDSTVRISTSDVYMPLTPMFHVHAWGMPYIATMLAMKQVYPGRYEPEVLLRLILKHKVSFSHCVPTILNMLVSNPNVRNYDLSFFRVIIGGSAFPFGLAKATMDLGIHVMAGYGLSETCPVLTLPYVNVKQRSVLSREDLAKELIKTGRPVMFVDLRLMNEEGEFLAFDGKAIGEVVVRAPWLTQCYFKEKERSEELWKFGYLHTGDIGYVEPNGTLVLIDRKKDVIKSGGEWISSLDIESVLSAIEGVKEVAVVGIPDEQWGERPIAMIVLQENRKVSEVSLQGAIDDEIQAGRLSKWAMPDRFIMVQEIPKTSVGKIDKKLIRSQLTEG